MAHCSQVFAVLRFFNRARPLNKITDRQLRTANKILVSVSVDQTVSHLTCFRPQHNVFANALVTYETLGESAAFDQLREYYSTVSYQTVADMWGSSDASYGRIPAMGVVMPWFEESFDSKLRRICVNPEATVPLSREAADYGLKPPEEFGWQFFGPVSEGVLKLEWNRLLSVYLSIRDNGYAPSKHGHMHGYVLASESNRKVVVMGGKHRYSALVALGVKTVPILLKTKACDLYVHEHQLNQWPQVMNGTYSYETASEIFKRQMSGVHEDF